MIGFLTRFARRARDFTTGPDRPVVWVELHPDGLAVRAAHGTRRHNHILTWNQIDNVKDEARDAMIDHAIMRAAAPILVLLETRKESA